MSNFKLGASFEIVGIISRKPFVAASGKFARLQLAVPGRGGAEKKIDIRAFSEIVGDICALGVGQTVRVTGDVDNEKLTAKDKSEVKVDGYAVWMPALTARAVHVEGASAAPPKAAKAEPSKKHAAAFDPDDDLAF